MHVFSLIQNSQCLVSTSLPPGSPLPLRVIPAAPLRVMPAAGAAAALAGAAPAALAGAAAPASGVRAAAPAAPAKGVFPIPHDLVSIPLCYLSGGPPAEARSAGLWARPEAKV